MDERPVSTGGVRLLIAAATATISSVSCNYAEALEERGCTSRLAGNLTRDQRTWARRS